MGCNHAANQTCVPECNPEMSDCKKCDHSHYDHIGWREESDKKTYCRIIGCECEYEAKVAGYTYTITGLCGSS